MRLFVLLKLAPDAVEELTIAPDGKSLDADVLRFQSGDADEHALETALLLKERHGGTLSVAALECPETDDVLFTALAKGADRAVKLTTESRDVPAAAAARMFVAFLQPGGTALPDDALVLVRSQAVDDLAGEIGPFVAEALHLPYVGVVTACTRVDDGVVVTKEFGGGLRGEFAVPLPAVLGIQSAEKPPRYVPIAKIRSVMKSAHLEEVAAPAAEAPETAPAVQSMRQPEASGRATMLEGSVDQMADAIVSLLAKQHLIPEGHP